MPPVKSYFPSSQRRFMGQGPAPGRSRLSLHHFRLPGLLCDLGQPHKPECVSVSSGVTWDSNFLPLCKTILKSRAHAIVLFINVINIAAFPPAVISIKSTLKSIQVFFFFQIAHTPLKIPIQPVPAGFLRSASPHICYVLSNKRFQRVLVKSNDILPRCPHAKILHGKSMLSILYGPSHLVVLKTQFGCEQYESGRIQHRTDSLRSGELSVNPDLASNSSRTRASHFNL